MAPNITEDEVDDLIYYSRAGENDELVSAIAGLSEREKCSPAEILLAVKDEGKSNCLHMASANAHLSVLISIQTGMQTSFAAFSKRVTNWMEGTVKTILDFFVDRPKDEKQKFLDTQNEYGNTSLHWAAMGGQLEIVKLLVQTGASASIANDREYIPLDLAALHNKTVIVDYFLSQSGTLEAGNESGLTSSAGGIDLRDDSNPKADGASGGA